MEIISSTIMSAGLKRLKLFFGTALLFASLAAAGQAESLYPQAIKPAQTSDVIRPCTQLELSAQLLPAECGKLTLSAVVVRMNALVRKDHDEN